MRKISIAEAVAGSLAQTIITIFAAALIVISLPSGSFASQLIINSSGGTASLGTDFTLTGSTVASPAGTVSLDCPITSVTGGTYAVNYNCSGGSYTYQSNDGTISVSAAFTTAAEAAAATFITITASAAISAGPRRRTTS